MDAFSGVAGTLLIVAVIIAVGVLYFAPLLVAHMTKSRQIGVVAVINVIFGWTMLGWVIALVIAIWTEKPVPQPWMPQMPPQYPYPYPSQQQWQWPAQPPFWHTDAATPPYGENIN